MLMSKSRLEKFLYALYSLDSSDLPNPISRIEELYKCWVTGAEVPTFEPISRVEKYLMAILGVYDVNELPNPISRVEVLLHKLAIGDDNLDDIKSFLSEHEELLAEIIRNGGVGGNIDIEYALYTLSTEHNTLYNTAEKPVKSAILKGQTLVNVHPTDYIVSGSSTTFFLSKIIPKTMIKPNTRYFLRLYNTHQSIVRAYFKPCVNNSVNLISSDNKCAIFTTKSEFTEYDFNNNKIHFYSSSELALEDVKDTKVILCEYVDGMENWDIPYFEGMQSVKMPVLKTVGKNLMPVNHARLDGIGANTGGHEKNLIAKNIPVTPGKTYTVSYSVSSSTNVLTVNITRYEHQEKTNSNNHVQLWDEIGKDDGNSTFTIPQGINYISFTFGNSIYTNNGIPGWIQFDNIQLQDGSVATEYEPYKTNILTTSEDVELRGIGEIKDTLDLLTGKLTQRIGENGEVLSQEVVKTVDLLVVDQDGNNTKLSTFDDITHVTLSSEELIPEAELEVATKNEEDLEDSSVYTTHTLSEEFNTLYNTAEKPVKGAILKGWSLVNLLKANKNDYIINLNPKNWSVEDGYLKCVSTTGWHTITDKFSSSIKPNTKYLIVAEIKENTLSMNINFDGYGTTVGSTINFLTFEPNEVGTKKAIITTISTLDNIKGGFFRIPLNITNNNSILKLRVMAIEYQEGMENWDIPYFEGMQSVKMPVLTIHNNGNLFNKNTASRGYYSANGENFTKNSSYALSDYIEIPYKMKLTSYSKKAADANFAYYCYDENKNYIKRLMARNEISIDLEENTKYVRISVRMTSPGQTFENDYIDVITNVGVNATNPELYKSNILTVNEDVTLRSNGDVYDELNLLTGRLTQRIDENNEVLTKEVVKTVDLSVVDQDGNDAKLSTFNDITHVTLSSEGLIPEAELEVAEKVPEVAASMLTISREQELINTTTNEQSENVDATMIATTEIYEQLL